VNAIIFFSSSHAYNTIYLLNFDKRWPAECRSFFLRWYTFLFCDSIRTFWDCRWKVDLWK